MDHPLNRIKFLIPIFLILFLAICITELTLVYQSDEKYSTDICSLPRPHLSLLVWNIISAWVIACALLIAIIIFVICYSVGERQDWFKGIALYAIPVMLIYSMFKLFWNIIGIVLLFWISTDCIGSLWNISLVVIYGDTLATIFYFLILHWWHKGKMTFELPEWIMEPEWIPE